MKEKYSAPYLYSEAISKEDVFAASGDTNSSSAKRGLDEMANGSSSENFIMFWEN